MQPQINSKYSEQCNRLITLQVSITQQSHVMRPIGKALVAIGTVSTLFAAYSQSTALLFGASVIPVVGAIAITVLGLYLLFGKTYADLELKKLGTQFLGEKLEKVAEIDSIGNSMSIAQNLGVENELRSMITNDPNFKAALSQSLENFNFDTDMHRFEILANRKLIADQIIELVRNTSSALKAIHEKKDLDCKQAQVTLDRETTNASVELQSQEQQVQAKAAAKYQPDLKRTISMENALDDLREQVITLKQQQSNLTQLETQFAKYEDDFNMKQEHLNFCTRELAIKNQFLEFARNNQRRHLSIHGSDNPNPQYETDIHNYNVEINKLSGELKYYNSLNAAKLQELSESLTKERAQCALIPAELATINSQIAQIDNELGLHVEAFDRIYTESKEELTGELQRIAIARQRTLDALKQNCTNQISKIISDAEISKNGILVTYKRDLTTALRAVHN